MQTKRPEAATAQQVSELFDSVELAKALDTEALKQFLDHIPIAIVVSNLLQGEQRLVYANKAFEALAGRTLAELRGRDWSALDGFRHEDDPQVTIGQALQNGEEFLGTFRLEAPTPVLAEIYASVIENNDGSEHYRIAALVDVTRRERAQRQEFARQIRDKDLLLKELQHRVKNNLQLITTLIRLEARGERSGEKANLERLAGRIDSLQLLYQELSARPAEEDIDLGHYLSQIASSVMRTHAVEGIKLDLKVETAPVSINIAMPVGLAVNELLTNAFKHAFAGRGQGNIVLECLRGDDDECRVVVADDGMGLPEGTTWPVDGKLGALIVQTLRENAKTALSVDSALGEGTRVTLSFVYKALARKAA
jgi:PAS domain S-box-containing protein